MEIVFYKKHSDFIIFYGTFSETLRLTLCNRELHNMKKEI